jgi:hypothetical protein
MLKKVAAIVAESRSRFYTLRNATCLAIIWALQAMLHGAIVHPTCSRNAIATQVVRKLQHVTVHAFMP